MTSSKQRIMEYLISQGISFAKAERIAGVGRGFLNVDSEMSTIVLKKFVVAFPDIDVRYVVTGESENFQTGNSYHSLFERASGLMDELVGSKKEIKELKKSLKEKNAELDRLNEIIKKAKVLLSI